VIHIVLQPAWTAGLANMKKTPATTEDEAADQTRAELRVIAATNFAILTRINGAPVLSLRSRRGVVMSCRGFPQYQASYYWYLSTGRKLQELQGITVSH
jgi:hypothetical protein